jgi:hypothetical protein
MAEACEVAAHVEIGLDSGLEPQVVLDSPSDWIADREA